MRLSPGRKLSLLIFKTINMHQRKSENRANLELPSESKTEGFSTHLNFIYQKNVHGDDGKEKPEREEIHSLFSTL